VVMKRLPLKAIKVAKYNPRKNLQPPDAEYQKLKRSMEQFGFVGGMVWNKRTGNLVSGHQRLKILRREFEVEEIDVSVVDLPPEREKLLNLALNKIVGEWDELALAAVLGGLLEDEDLDATLTGFDQKEIDATIAGVLEESEAEAAIKAVTIYPYPKMSWTLIGIPFKRHGEVAKYIEKMSAVKGASVECSYSD